MLIINKTHRNFIGSGTVWCLEFVKIPFFVGDNDDDLSSTVGGVLDVEILKGEEELAISVKAFRVGLKSFMTFLFIIKIYRFCTSCVGERSLCNFDLVMFKA